MKKNLKKLVFTFLIGCYTLANAQNTNFVKSAPTTEIEYNYITKGYKVQIESGLDMKKGYIFNLIGEQQIGNYLFSTSVLKRIPQNEIAGILIKAKSNVSGNTYYFCIPHGNSSLTQRYIQDLNSWDADITKAYAFYISNYFSETYKNYSDTLKNLNTIKK